MPVSILYHYQISTMIFNNPAVADNEADADSDADVDADADEGTDDNADILILLMLS